MKYQKGNCLFPGCLKTTYGRGLCASHYNTARRLVLLKQTTWTKLEKEGKSLPAYIVHHASKVAEWFLNGKPAITPLERGETVPRVEDDNF